MAKRTSEKYRRSAAQRRQVRDAQKVSRGESASMEAPSKHKSFRRSYREDYARETNVPGMGHQIVEAFRLIFANWKVMGAILLAAVVIELVLVGVPGSALEWQLDETSGVMGALVFLMIWLTTIYALRRRMAGKEVDIRETFFNSMGPLLSTLVVLVVALIQCVPIVILVIAYSAAVETELLATPFHALLFWGFGALMILLTGYLWSSTLMALVAVSAPGLYPLKALKVTNDLMLGRRMKFVLRLVALLLVLALMWVVILGPVAALAGATGWTWLAGVVAVILACFSAIYAAVYLYTYYKYMLET